ncbi:MAG: type III glutamate--ammonia ligase, partial [Cyanobacteria bacterium P01_F01_bin.86]
LTATFMPKPFSHLTGNGAHLHNSLWQGDVNAFEVEADEGGLSPVGYHFLAGVLAHAKGLAALCSPTVNSYRRLGAMTTTSGSTWSPRYISYGGNNRTHMLRIPEAGRFECRLVDGAANLYLALAGLLTAGLEGMEQQLVPGPRIEENMFVRGSEFPDLDLLPANLLDALEFLKQDSLLMGALGEAAAKTLFEFKYEEWRQYSAQITPWEMDQYVNC